MNVLDLFSGIGGFSLGLERAGMRTVAFCEIEPYCRAVLKKHWPHVPIYEDVRELTAARLAADGIAVDVICGGFPCQDISTAGKGAGIEGERSGLWSEYARIIGELRPRYVVVENVAALLNRGLDRVLRDLAALRFDAEWHCIPAAAIGAPHRRDRLWLVAYPNGSEWREIGRTRQRLAWADCLSQWKEGAGRFGSSGQNVADADNTRLPDRRQTRQSQGEGETEWGMALPEFERCSRAWWETEPDVGRVVDGLPSRVDRLKALGNAVVPQIPEIIGHAIMAAL